MEMNYFTKSSKQQAGDLSNQASSAAYPPNQASSAAYPPNQASYAAYPPNQASSAAYPPNQAPSAAYPPNQASYAAYPPNPTTSAAYPPYIVNSPAYIQNPPAYTPNQVPTYSTMPPSYPYGGQTGVIMTSQSNVIALPQAAYRDYLVWSIVNLIFNNLILGIVAVIYSTRTRDAVRCGDYTSAAIYSRTAFRLNVAALILGIISHVIWIAWVIYWSVTYNQPYQGYSHYSIYYGK